MRSQKDLLHTLCRICGQEDKKCTPVFDEYGKSQAIQKKVRICLQLTVEETDLLPKQLCNACLYKLDIAWNLVQLSKEGQLTIARKLKANSSHNDKESFFSLIETKTKALKGNEKISLTGTACISLAPSSIPLPQDTSCAVVPLMASSHMMVFPASISPATVSVPESQWNSARTQPFNQQLQQRQAPMPTPRSSTSIPPPVPVPSSQQNTSLPVKRRVLKEGGSSNVPPAKRPNQMCRYCKKIFPDNIIDYHVNLHFRQSFITCIECNKNFRSEQAMSSHRCNANSSINLVSDEDEPIDL